MTTDNNRKKIGFSFMSIAVACVFLFNANINIIDLVPDIIGYLIICVALLKLSNLNEDVAQAAKFFRYMIIWLLRQILFQVWRGIYSGFTLNRSRYLFFTFFSYLRYAV